MRASEESTAGRARESVAPAWSVIIWRVEEDEVPRAGRLAQEGEGVAAIDDRRVELEGGEVASDRRDRPGVPVDEGRVPRPPRETLDPERSRAREQVEHARSPSGPRIEKSASRTRSEVGRVPRPGGAMRRRPRSWPATTRNQTYSTGGATSSRSSTRMES